VGHERPASGANSDYREFGTFGPLAESVFCLWTQQIGPDAEFSQPVFPDGCVDIVVMNGTPMVVGPWTEPFTARLAPGTRITGARCRPGMAASLLGVPASELRNASMPLEDVAGRKKSLPFRRVSDAESLEGKVAGMEAAVLECLANVPVGGKATGAAIEWMARNPRSRVEEIGRRLGLSNRQLLRRFEWDVGYGPKLLQSVLRFQRLLRLSEKAGVQGSLARLSAQTEYADQAHMTREVRRFSGQAPGALLPTARCALRLSRLMENPPSAGRQATRM
jgi:AraC-like DNA-binding protein